MAIMAALQQIDVALFDKVFHLGREYKAMTKGAIALSRSGDGYLQVLTPALVWLSGSLLAPTYAIALAIAMLAERIIYYIMKITLSVCDHATLRKTSNHSSPHPTNSASHRATRQRPFAFQPLPSSPLVARTLPCLSGHL